MDKRTRTLKLLKISHIIVLALVILIFLSWFLPCFSYAPPAGKEGVRSQTSMWGMLFFNYKFPQIEDVMKSAINVDAGDKTFKYLNLRYLGLPMIMFFCGIVVICTVKKKSIPYTVFPLLMSACGIYAWLFGNFIPPFANIKANVTLMFVPIVLLAVFTVIQLVLMIAEISSRPEDYYLPSVG